MKLIGSKVERDIREQLIRSHELLFCGQDNRKLFDVLKTAYPNLKTAYILGWTPEQGEDIFLVLLEEGLIKIVLDRCNEVSPSTMKIDLENYKKRLSRVGQIKLAVALDLINKDLNRPRSVPS